MEKNQSPTTVLTFHMPCFPASMIRCSMSRGMEEGAKWERNSIIWASNRPTVRW